MEMTDTNTASGAMKHPKFPAHPEPHILTWSALETSAIARYGREMYEAGRRDALASAPAQPVAEPDAAYAALPAPESYGTRNGQIDPKQPLFTEDDMRAFADATCALRIKSRVTEKAEHDARHRLAMTMAGGGA